MGYYNISDEEFENIKYGKDYQKVTPEVIEDQRRWATLFSQVFQKLDDGTFWELTWERGSTEYQECDLDATKVQVKPVSVQVTNYVPID